MCCAGGGAAVPKDVQGLVESLYGLPSPPRAVLSVTGSGGQALAWLMAVPGASAVLLEATVPYSTASSRHWQGGKDAESGYCSEEAALALAREAFRRAVSLTVLEHGKGFAAVADAPVLGLGCTASVASTRPKRGAHRCFVAVASAAGASSYSFELSKGARDRLGEDVAVSRLVIRALAEAAAVPLPAGFCEEGAVAGEETPEAVLYRQPDALQGLRSGASSHVVVVPGPTAASEPLMLPNVAVPAPAVIFPGSYNPLHGGHLALLEAATRVYAREVLGLSGGEAAAFSGITTLFEMSVSNADKGMMAESDVLTRTAQFTDEATAAGAAAAAAAATSRPARRKHPLVLTRAPLFVQKARLFPGSAFVVGADTARRIVDVKYYGDSAADMAAALAEIHALGCCFVVGGRREAEGGAFCTGAAALAGSPLPAPLKEMFYEIPEEEFRADISSTALRAAAAASVSS